MYGPEPEGSLCYLDDGYMSVIIAASNRPEFASEDYADWTVEEKSGVPMNYWSYSGRYSVEGDIVSHHIEICILPNWNGKTEQRRFRLVDDKLILHSVTPYKMHDQIQGMEIVWRRP